MGAQVPCHPKQRNQPAKPGEEGAAAPGSMRGCMTAGLWGPPLVTPRLSSSWQASPLTAPLPLFVRAPVLLLLTLTGSSKRARPLQSVCSSQPLAVLGSPAAAAGPEGARCRAAREN